MAITIVRLGGARLPGEGLRLGTVRRPPRGVRKEEYAKRNFFDLWFPNLAPTEALLKASAPGAEAAWRTFERKFRAEMKAAGPARDLDLLAALSHSADFSIGCYCENESRCHRSVLRDLLVRRGAQIR